MKSARVGFATLVLLLISSGADWPAPEASSRPQIAVAS